MLFVIWLYAFGDARNREEGRDPDKKTSLTFREFKYKSAKPSKRQHYLSQMIKETEITIC